MLWNQKIYLSSRFKNIALKGQDKEAYCHAHEISDSMNTETESFTGMPEDNSARLGKYELVL